MQGANCKADLQLYRRILFRKYNAVNKYSYMVKQDLFVFDTFIKTTSTEKKEKIVF